MLIVSACFLIVLWGLELVFEFTLSSAGLGALWFQEWNS